MLMGSDTAWTLPVLLTAKPSPFLASSHPIPSNPIPSRHGHTVHSLSYHHFLQVSPLRFFYILAAFIDRR